MSGLSGITQMGPNAITGVRREAGEEKNSMRCESRS